MIGSEFRRGNVAPAAQNLAFIKQCIGQLPAERTIKWLRADSASYQSAIFNYCEANGITFAIGARLDSTTLEDIESMKAWRTVCVKEGVSHFYEESD